MYIFAQGDSAYMWAGLGATLGFYCGGEVVRGGGGLANGWRQFCLA